jgi:hypothetical protein
MRRFCGLFVFAFCALLLVFFSLPIAMAWSDRDRSAYPRALPPYRSVTSRY